MNRTSAGRQLYAVGGNAEAARRVGINIAAMHFLAYGYLGLMAGLAGLVQAHRVGEACRTRWSATSSTCWRRRCSAGRA